MSVYRKIAINVYVWFLLVAMISQVQATQPIPGEIVGTYVVPDVFHSLNGLAWDGKYLWGVDYVEGRPDGIYAYLPEFLQRFFTPDTIVAINGKAYQMSTNDQPQDKSLKIIKSLSLNLPAIEGAAHNKNGILFVGLRLVGTRSSAMILGINDSTGERVKQFNDFSWPDNEVHGNYRDPDGIAFDGKNIIWVANGDHADLKRAAVQIVSLDGEIIKRFWLPDEKANDVTYAKGYLIYKPASKNHLKMIKINDAEVPPNIKIVPISSGKITDHWGVTHDGEKYLYISQDKPGSKLWKLYLPLPSNND